MTSLAESPRVTDYAAMMRMISDAIRQHDPAYTWLYFIQAGESGPVKIGTSRDPRARLSNMQVNNHERLTLLAAARVLPETEGDVHEDLSLARLHGEWYMPTAQVLDEAAHWASRGDAAWLVEPTRPEMASAARAAIRGIAA